MPYIPVVIGYFGPAGGRRTQLANGNGHTSVGNERSHKTCHPNTKYNNESRLVAVFLPSFQKNTWKHTHRGQSQLCFEKLAQLERSTHSTHTPQFAQGPTHIWSKTGTKFFDHTTCLKIVVTDISTPEMDPTKIDHPHETCALELHYSKIHVKWTHTMKTKRPGTSSLIRELRSTTTFSTRITVLYSLNQPTHEIEQYWNRYVESKKIVTEINATFQCLDLTIKIM